MALITCQDCGRQVSDTSLACIYCGRPAVSAEQAYIPAESANAAYAEGPFSKTSTTVPVEAAGVAPQLVFRALSIQKLIVLSVCTLGFYELYWFFQNWKRLKEHTGRDLSPFWRAFFAPLWAYSLFGEVKSSLARRGLAIGWSAGWLGLLYFVWSAMWRLPDPYWLVSLFTFVPIVPVQNLINAAAAQEGTSPDQTYSGKHIAVIALGSVLVVFVLLGTFFPE